MGQPSGKRGIGSTTKDFSLMRMQQSFLLIIEIDYQKTYEARLSGRCI